MSSATGIGLRAAPIEAQPVSALCRRILLFPGGNNVTQLSVYLDVADSATLPQGWSRQAHFTLTVHNQKDPSRSVIKGTPLDPLHSVRGDKLIPQIAESMIVHAQMRTTSSPSASATGVSANSCRSVSYGIRAAASL